MVTTLTEHEIRAHFRAAQRDGIPLIPESLRQSWDRFPCGGLSTLERETSTIQETSVRHALRSMSV